ncbi:MAG TPA: neprosin family prolyl endopeptidase, partial [Streptosporangiaceae bacterium]|nr:neprosin family prolyl endopeptidase [Streptosporangiaceae bacterium]
MGILGISGRGLAAAFVSAGALAAVVTAAPGRAASIGTAAVAVSHPAGVKAPPPSFPAAARTVPATQQCDVAYLRYGACYDYAGATQTANDQGASVSFPVESPNLAWNSLGYHTLMEMAVFNRTATGIDEDTAEVGWTVQSLKAGQPPVPHLFVYHFVNTKGTCYNGCGFVRTSTKVVPGMALKPGTKVTWTIRNVDHKWTFWFDGTRFGYIPDSAYQGTFGHASMVNVYGEIAGAGTTPSCNQMGNRLYGTQPGAATISGFRLYGTSAQPDLTPYSPTDPAAWDNTTTTNTFSVGGPGD